MSSALPGRHSGGREKAVKRLPPAGRRSRYLMINVTLTNDLDEFLQSVGNEARRTGGYKLPKTLILRALARVLQELKERGKIDVAGVRTEQEFLGRVREAFGLK